MRESILLNFASGFTQRRFAIILRVSRTTVVRKFILMGRLSLAALRCDNMASPLVSTLQFDDLETFVHTKCKPLSVTLAVEHGSRRILGFRVSDMPAKGGLAKISREKYGPRKDGRPEARAELFPELRPLITPDCVIMSDQNPHYVSDVRTHFPGHEHVTCKGRRGCVTGQGELKAGGHDPLFSLNHTYAMLRANISRLFRRTWNTTKLKERLGDHIAIYAVFHNRYLIHHPAH